MHELFELLFNLCFITLFDNISLDLRMQISENIIHSTMKTVPFRCALATGVTEGCFAVQSKLQDCRKQVVMLHIGDPELTATFQYISNNEPNGVARNYPCRRSRICWESYSTQSSELSELENGLHCNNFQCSPTSQRLCPMHTPLIHLHLLLPRGHLSLNQSLVISPP